MQRRHLWFIVGAVAALSLVLSSVAGASSQRAPKPRAGGTVIFGADQEPGFLNTFVVGGSHFWAGQIVTGVFAGSYILTPQFEFKEYLAKVKVQSRPFRITYTINKNAVWYEPGKKRFVPVTASDYIFTYQTIMNKKWNIASVTGYDQIVRFKRINAKTIQFVFKSIYSSYQGLFGLILPRHALAGEDFNNAFRNNLDNPKTGKPIASGPFYLSGWSKGQHATLIKNPRFWGKKAYLNRVVIRFLKDTQTTATQVRGGEVDVIYPQPQAFLVPLRSERSLRFQVGYGPVWEHIDMNQGYKGKGHPALKRKNVRIAIMRAINRPSLVNALFRRTGISPRHTVLESAIFVSNSRYYKPHWKQHTYNPTASIRLLRAAGCTGGPTRPGGDGIFTCAGQRMSLNFVWTAGNQRRALVFEIAQQQLKNVGIDLNPAPTPPSLIFSRRLPQGDYDLTIFAWVGSPLLGGWHDAYGCLNEAKNLALDNWTGYCNRTVDRLLKRVQTTLSYSGQAALTNQALAQMGKDVPVIPMYQLPTYLIHRRNIHGLKENPTSAGPLWNVEFWYKTSAA